MIASFRIAETLIAGDESMVTELLRQKNERP